MRIEITGSHAEQQLNDSSSATLKKKITINLNQSLTFLSQLVENDQVHIRKVILLKCGIVGLSRRPSHLKPGSELKLVRFPNHGDNKWLTLVQTTTGIGLGSLPINKDQSAARLMDAGKVVKAVVIDPADSEIEVAKKKAESGEDFHLPLAIYMEIQDKEKM